MKSKELVSLEKKQKVFISILIIIIVLVVTSIIILIINPFENEKEINLEEELLKTAKEYYNESSELLPSEVGECSILTLETLMAKDRIDNPDIYSDCNKYNSYVKNCKLEKGYHYVPMLSCNDMNTENLYSDWKDGTEKDISEFDDVKFVFQGYTRKENEDEEILEGWLDEIDTIGYDILSNVNYYRYRDMEWRYFEIRNEYYTDNDINSDILAYYTNKPDEQYLNSDSQTTVYKWYTQEQKITSSYKVYVCKNDAGNLLSSNEMCENRIDEYLNTYKAYETCGIVNKNSIDESDKYVEVEPSSICDSKIIKTYYPSGSDEASQEKVYYKDAPVANAIKDLNTRATGARYYKETEVMLDGYYASSPSTTAMKSNEFRWKDWSSYSTTKPKQYDNREIETREKVKYVLAKEDIWEPLDTKDLTRDELLSKIKELNYKNINSLEDIDNSIDLKYTWKMQYRKRNN